MGNIGRLPRLTCHVDQILSDDEMLVRCLFSLKVTSVERFQPRYETVVRPVTFLVRGLSTQQTHEAADLELLQVFEVSGTHTYRTVGGSQATVHVLSPFDMKAIEPYFQALAAPAVTRIGTPPRPWPMCPAGFRRALTASFHREHKPSPGPGWAQSRIPVHASVKVKSPISGNRWPPRREPPSTAVDIPVRGGSVGGDGCYNALRGDR